MFSRLQPFVYVSALALAALQCKSSDGTPARSADSEHEQSSQAAGRGASGVTSEAPAATAAPSRAEADQRPERSEPHVKLDDAQIVAITDAANQAEIQQGRVAREKAKDPRVRDFAAMMVDHHAEARDDRKKLSVEPGQSEQAQRMQDDAEHALKSLKQKSGKDFDRAYLQLQIDEHREVLDALNDLLLPAVKDAQLKAYLEELQPKVQSHLVQAERLQEELSGQSSLTESGQRPLISNTRGSGANLSNR